MSVFHAQLDEYKRSVNEDIATYAAHIKKSADSQYGARGGEVTDLFIAELLAQVERIPGVLAYVAYEMLGGRDRHMIARAATALEMMHAYAHILETVTKDSKGQTDLLQAGVIGMHAAQMLFAGLSVDPELKVKVLGIVNLAMVVTGHGRVATSEDSLRVIEWKTANHLTLNPLCVGMVLAAADCHDTDAIRDYALQLGSAIAIPGLEGKKYAKRAVETLVSSPSHWGKSQVSFLKSFALHYTE